MLLLCVLLSFTAVKAQKIDLKQPNIVPNPGFELFAGASLGWYYKGEHFNSTIKYWTSPTASSPDVYGPRVRVPESWAEKGFGKTKAHSGQSMIGITTFGCENGKPHCREYVQVLLAEPLVEGQQYSLEFYYSHLPLSIQINNIGAYFSKTKINNKLEEPLQYTPWVYQKEIMSAPTRWHKFSESFKANTSAEYMILGNFFADNQTLNKTTKINGHNFAYYYIDDVVLKKVPPILPIPVADDDLTKTKIEKGKVVPLKNIYFDTNGFELEPRSFFELKKLLFLLRENPTMSIEIRGHTDNQGTHEYNQKLSEGRAASVANFLVYNGIKKYRIKSKGLGEGKPISDNESDEGKQSNRRVEFLILSK